MKINGDFIKREIAGDILLIPTGETALKFNGMITMTETGSLIWDEILKGSSKENIIKAMLENYEVSEDEATEDIDQFINRLKDAGFVSE